MTTPPDAARGRQAENALVNYAAETNRSHELSGVRGPENLLADLLTDAMHFATAMHIDFQHCIDRAQTQFRADQDRAIADAFKTRGRQKEQDRDRDDDDRTR